jgi:hypothetical protein
MATGNFFLIRTDVTGALLFVDNDRFILDSNDGRPGDAPFLDGPESQPLKPSRLAVYQFSNLTGIARIAMLRLACRSQLDNAAQMFAASIHNFHSEQFG